MKKWWMVLGLGAWLCGAAGADVIIWSEDFSNVADWLVAWEQHVDTGATISTDGSFGLMYVERNDSGAAFSPSAFMAFNEGTWSTYNLSFDVESISWSMSYQVGFDEFDAGYNYVGSVTVHPQGTFVGSTNYSLAGVSWDAGVTYVRPKITMSTGDGGQTLTINEIQLAVIPEPGAALLFGLGLATVALFRCLKPR